MRIVLLALILTLFGNINAAGIGGVEEDEVKWQFDQERNVAAVTTRQVMHQNLPVLSVTHYEDDHSWAFTCGTTSKSEDLMLVGMSQIIDKDTSLHSIADLPPGWSAYRNSVEENWVRTKDE